MLDLIAAGESQSLEFKSTARFDVKQNKTGPYLERVIVKTIAAFLNTKGGTLVIGVEDNGTVYGLTEDYKLCGNKGRDGFENWLMQTLMKDFGKDAARQLSVAFHQLGPADESKPGSGGCVRRDGSTLPQAAIRHGKRPGAAGGWMLLFIDESGHDHHEMPCEVLAGVAVSEDNLWNLVKAVRSAEKDFFGDYLRNLRQTEMKAKKLLKKKRFNSANRPVVIAPADLLGLANGALTSGATASERQLVGYSRQVLGFVHEVLNIAARHSVQVIASVVDINSPRPAPGILRKDYVYLFERYFYLLEALPPRERGLIVFDEMEKSQSHVLIQQMAKYFLGTQTGRYRSSRVVPEPFFVHSDLTTGIFLADLTAYILWMGIATREDEPASTDRVEALRRQTPRNAIPRPTTRRRWYVSTSRDLLISTTFAEDRIARWETAIRKKSKGNDKSLRTNQSLRRNYRLEVDKSQGLPVIIDNRGNVVPEAVWNFHIGGYQACGKWLKDRKGRTLSRDDMPITRRSSSPLAKRSA